MAGGWGPAGGSATRKIQSKAQLLKWLSF